MGTEILNTIEKQRDYFMQGKTMDIKFRKNALIKLKMSIEQNIKPLLKAFKRDFNKGDFDVFSTEIYLVTKEINYMLRNLKKLTRPNKVRASLINFPSKGKIFAEPYGVALIVSPWNYPFQLAMMPLVGAIAAGNCAVVKPSSSSENVSMAIKKILSVFDDSYISVLTGNRNENENLFDQNFDFVFFTGGLSTAKMLMSKLANNITPAIFELGGKSPCIIDADADIDSAARRSVWAKFLNAGQTCIAPDYFLVHKSIKTKFLAKSIEYIKRFYYTDNKINENFVHIISDRQLKSVLSFIDRNKVVFGGEVNERLLEPTIMDNVSFDDAVMQQEIFGPIMPLIEFDSLEHEVSRLKTMPKPLALYYFGSDKKRQQYITKNVSFGGGCINDTIMHVSEQNLPFGGVGNSGMGKYHGKYTFDAFTHYKSVLIKSSKIEIPLKYSPYNDKKTRFMKWYSGL